MKVNPVASIDLRGQRWTQETKTQRRKDRTAANRNGYAELCQHGQLWEDNPTLMRQLTHPVAGGIVDKLEKAAKSCRPPGFGQGRPRAGADFNALSPLTAEVPTDEQEFCGTERTTIR